MPPVHRNNYQPREHRGVGYWRHQYLNGIVLPLLPNVLPFYHSPNMVPNAQKKVYYWNWKEGHRINFRDDKVRDPIHEYLKSDGGFSSPVPRKRHLIGIMENSGLDDSSEDSFQSNASENGKNMRRIYCPANSKGNRTNNSVYYYHHNNHRPEHLRYRRHCYGQNYGERRYSGRHSPVEYASQNNHRNHDHHYEDQCVASKSHSDMTSNHGNNCHTRHNSQNFEPIPPDRFLSRSHLIEATWSQASIRPNGEWTKLSMEIYTKFMSNQQTEIVFREKMYLWKKLFMFIRGNFAEFRLFLVGSTMNGFGSNKSDVDMCLMVRPTEIKFRFESISYLNQITTVLKNGGFVKRVELIHAKVPILKFESLGLEVDLNCNNAVGIRNTHLLYCYSQCGVSPPVLPCLQEMYKDKFSPDSDINQIDLHEKLDPYFSNNHQSLGELLVGFLKYYCEFKYSEYAISIRLATKLKKVDCKLVKNSKNDPFEWKYLCIEEPFDLTNAARSVHNGAMFDRICKIFRHSYQILSMTRCLDSIFNYKID